MDIAIVGAAGACGRQLAVQLLESGALQHSGRFQLVGHHGGHSENELWGLRADLEDAFSDIAPPIEVVLDADTIDADIVVMLAGATLSTDPNVVPDRAALGRANAAIFRGYADALARTSGAPPIVIVQSNPVELGVQILGEAVGRHRVIGAGAWSDTLRFRQEIAGDLGTTRPAVTAPMVGQHGDHLVPLWSQVRVRGIGHDELPAKVAELRRDRDPADLPAEIVALRPQVLDLIRGGDVIRAYDLIASQPPDLRVALKPFFTHFSAGHTTEVVTAHSVADIIRAIVDGHRRVMTAQVHLEGEWLGLHGVIGAPVIVGAEGWVGGLQTRLHDDEMNGIERALAAIADANAGLLAT